MAQNNISLFSVALGKEAGQICDFDAMLAARTEKTEENGVLLAPP